MVFLPQQSQITNPNIQTYTTRHFEHGNEYSNYKKKILRRVISPTICRIRAKTSCITKCVPSELCSLLGHLKFRSLYIINDLVFLFLFVIIIIPLIDFYIFTRQYPWRNSKTNGRITSNTMICCKQSVPTCSMLC